MAVMACFYSYQLSQGIIVMEIIMSSTNGNSKQSEAHQARGNQDGVEGSDKSQHVTLTGTTVMNLSRNRKCLRNFCIHASTHECLLQKGSWSWSWVKNSSQRTDVQTIFFCSLEVETWEIRRPDVYRLSAEKVGIKKSEWANCPAAVEIELKARLIFQTSLHCSVRRCHRIYLLHRLCNNTENTPTWFMGSEYQDIFRYQWNRTLRTLLP